MIAPPLVQFAQNIWLLIGLLLFAAFVVLMIITLWTLLKMWLWRASKRRADQERHDLKYRADGKPYPPAGRGFCDNCEQSCQKVYYMPNNRRLCPDCYGKFHES